MVTIWTSFEQSWAHAHTHTHDSAGIAEIGQDRDPEWGTWGVEANEEKDKDTTGNEMAGVCARQAKTRKGVMKTKASAGVGKHKRGRNEGGTKGLTREYPDLCKQK